MTEIVRLKASDPGWSARVAAIHAAEIHHGVLPLLGEKFLARLYRGLAGAPRSGVWAAVDGGTILGFLAGCADARATYRRVALGGAVPLGVGLIVRLAGSPALRRKVAALIGYARREPAAASTASPAGAGGRGHAELLAIAVAADQQGRGAGRLLVEAFESAVRKWGVDHYWVSTNIAETASNQFYRARGFVPAGTIAHHDLTLQRYRKRLSHVAPPGQRTS
jgi:GNAT superfamily N-acetyltransferase